MRCATGMFLMEDNTCIDDCIWDELNFRYVALYELNDDGEEITKCVNEFGCPEGYGVDWNLYECRAPVNIDEVTTPNCIAFHWHDDNDNPLYWCDACEFGYYFRDYAFDIDTEELYPPFCYPNFWMSMEDNLRPYYDINNFR